MIQNPSDQNVKDGVSNGVYPCLQSKHQLVALEIYTASAMVSRRKIQDGKSVFSITAQIHLNRRDH